MSTVVLVLARLVRLAVGIIVLLIVAAILLRVLGANSGNSIVHDVHDAGHTLVGPFHNLFSLKHPKVGIAVNWGIAAAVWLAVGWLVASVIARIGLTIGNRNRP